MNGLIFQLFKTIHFKVTDPIALIEAFCFQSDFYANYDAVPVKERKIAHVNRIGARINEELLPRCEMVLHSVKGLRIFQYDNDLDRLVTLDSGKIEDVVRELNDKAIKGLMTKRIGLSKATKILHTFHPETVPMFDNQLQELYLEKINSGWIVGDAQIFIDYYQNFTEGDTWNHLKAISRQLQENNLRLTRVRLFDILWWSFLKSRNVNTRLEKEKGGAVKWQTLHSAGW